MCLCVCVSVFVQVSEFTLQAGVDHLSIIDWSRSASMSSELESSEKTKPLSAPPMLDATPSRCFELLRASVDLLCSLMI